MPMSAGRRRPDKGGESWSMDFDAALDGSDSLKDKGQCDTTYAQNRHEPEITHERPQRRLLHYLLIEHTQRLLRQQVRTHRQETLLRCRIVRCHVGREYALVTLALTGQQRRHHRNSHGPTQISHQIE